MSHVYAELKNQYKFKNQLTFLFLYNKYREDKEIIPGKKLPITLSITQNLTQCEIETFNIQLTLESRIQSVETQKSGWTFQRINTMGTSFDKSGELKSSSHVKVPQRNSAKLNMKIEDKYCFFWSLLASLHPIFDSKIGHATRVSYYSQYFNELNINGVEFSNGFKCGDVHKNEKLNGLSVNIIELNFYKDQNEWKHKLIPIEISKKQLDGVVDLLIYKKSLCSH